MMRLLGPDTGFDSIGEFSTALSMARFLDRLDSRGILPQTILYNLNPVANEMVATMIGNFQDGSVPGKIQFGSGWWFNDQKDGMERQMNALSVLGLLSRFVGMLTDSRSFLSYPRHEYFRRTLCNLLGRDVENGEMPVGEMPRIRQMVEDICYYNAKTILGSKEKRRYGKTWRWFGKKDKITLSMLRQIGVEGIVTALHDIPNGEIWPYEAWWRCAITSRRPACVGRWWKACR